MLCTGVFKDVVSLIVTEENVTVNFDIGFRQ